MIGNPNQQYIYIFGLACCFGMAAEIALAGRLTWRWPVWSCLFLIGFIYSYHGGKLK